MDLGVLGWHQAWMLPIQFSSVTQSYWLFATPRTAAHQTSLSITTTSGVYSNSCPLSWWCHPNISSSVVPFSSHLQSFPLQISQVFTSGGQNIGISVSELVLPMNTQDWFPLGWTGWMSAAQGTVESLLQHHSSNASILQCSAFFIVQLSHAYMTTGKTIVLTKINLCWQSNVSAF